MSSKNVCGTQMKAPPKCFHISPEPCLVIWTSRRLPCCNNRDEPSISRRECFIMVAKDRRLAVQASACHAIIQSLLVVSPGRCAHIYMKWWYWYLHGSISCELSICDSVSHAMKFRQVSFLAGQWACSESQSVPRQKQQNHTSGPAPKRPHS